MPHRAGQAGKSATIETMNAAGADAGERRGKGLRYAKARGMSTGAPVSGLEKTLAAGKFAITAEVTPPLSAAAEALLEKALPLKGVVDAVNVTDAASARVHMSSVAAAALLAREGIEPVVQMTCRDRNRIALECDLLGAAALGVHNVLILGGDDPKAGDHPDAKPVFDFDSRGLIEVAASMRDEGKLPSGREIKPPPALFLGAADLPIDPPDDWKPDGLAAKIDAGAGFVQTQFCFDMDVVRRYAERLGAHGITERVGILIGIGPLASARSARWMRENLFGTIIPDAVVERMDGAEDPKAEGVEICAELLQALAEIPGIAGAHLMAPLNEKSVPATVDRAGVRGRERA
jgi:methylenetetrahydrofolate reductase (NADPH)